ncbi:hypothetical protein ATANTOWER_028894 [Ataeniobius toweri]|uniref:Uncharacterized protein n=1 Tax=Ataeniobius toweri TaxID=208326 RepID=A0ABU7CD48_9TELE|nr:hypothetical protein [Ataeniobius toweri]
MAALCLAPSIFPSDLTSFPVLLLKSIPQHGATTTMFHHVHSVFRVMCSVSFYPHILFCMSVKELTSKLTCPELLLTRFLFPLHDLWQRV